MTCPAPPTVDSGPSWLDRLRSSRGFPAHHGLDLDHFLLLAAPNPSPSSPTPPSPPRDPPPAGDTPVLLPLQRQRKEATGARGHGKKWFDLMSCALAELFHMGDPRELRAAGALRKSSRKQPNPRICVASAPASNAGSCPEGERAAGGGGVAAASPPSAENSTAGAKRWPEGKTKARRKRAAPCGGAAESPDLSAYSRTEVTVIDTSSPSWKSQKVIFRKGLVWKVRDKKAWNVCRKKRKLGVVKRLTSEKGQEQLPFAGKKKAPGKEHLASSNGGFVHNDRRDISKDISCEQNRLPKRRVQFSRSSRRPITKDSSPSCL